MNSLNLPRKKLILIIAIAVGFLILVTVIFAPNNQISQQGSTYGRDPSGYGAWAAFMEEKGTPIQRWQKPLEKLSRSPRRRICFFTFYDGQRSHPCRMGRFLRFGTLFAD